MLDSGIQSQAASNHPARSAELLQVCVPASWLKDTVVRGCVHRSLSDLLAAIREGTNLLPKTFLTTINGP